MRTCLFFISSIISLIFTAVLYPEVKPIATAKDFESIVEQSGQAVNLVAFETKWCGYCKKLKPILNSLSEKYADKLNFYSVDAEQVEEAAKKYKITFYPVVIFIKNGKEQDRMLGYNDKPYVEDLIKKNIK